MKRYDYLIIALFCFALSGLLILAISCAPVGIKPQCLQNAIYATTTYGVHYPVRLMHGPVYDDKVNHIQGQAFVGGNWTWLCVSNGWVVPCSQDMPGRWIPKYETDIYGALNLKSVPLK